MTFVTSSNDVAEVPVGILDTVLYPIIQPGGIVNGATFAAGPIAPGSIVSIFGADLDYREQYPQVSPGAAIPRYTAPVNVYPSIPFGGLDYFYLSSQQLNVQVPVNLQTGTYWMTIGTSNPVAFTVADVAPYVFLWGNGHGAVLNADYSTNQSSSPAAAGSTIMVYLTGQGAVDPPVYNGQAGPSDPISKVKAKTDAAIDARSAEVSFAGMAPGLVGVCQVNVRIPHDLPAGQHRLIIAMDGVKSNEVLIDTM